MKRRITALMITLCMVLTMMPMHAHATEAGHVHYGGEATCRWKATCEGCGSIYGETDPNNHNDYFGEDNGDGRTHTAMCTCGHIYNASEPHDFSGWEEDGPGQEARFCYECYYTETRSTHTHSYSAATCTTPATCSCNATQGDVDKNNHVGGTELRNAKEATEFESGYTGDTYCLGCGDVITYGVTIPATHTHSYSAATCTTPATCSCNATQGGVDKNNHVGGTEIRGQVNAGEFTEGYTGDTYCKGCGDVITYGVTIPATHTHSYSAATCTTPATCSCGATSGSINETNHAGGTEIRGQVSAGEFTEGYTGDTYCLGCGDVITYGVTIPATHTHSYNSYDYDRNGHWKVCTCGATQAAEGHDWYIYKKDANKHYWRCDCGNNGWGNDHFDNNATGKCDDCGYEMASTYKVTFNANGGTGTMSPQTFTAGVEQSLTPNTYTREGYFFLRWNTAENGGGQGYTDGQSITITENLTLYALWHQHTYGGYIYTDETGHYKECTDSDCPDENKGRTATESHTGDINSSMGCTFCHYSTIPLTVSISPTYLINGGTITITTSKYADQVTAYKDYTITTSDHINWTATIPGNTSACSHFTATAGKKTVESESFYLSPTFWIKPTAETLIGGGTVTLITAVPVSSVTCDASGINVQGSGDEWTVTLPNSTSTYTFTATLDNYTDTCTVSVTAHTHKYTFATCTFAGICSCGATSGVNPNIHVGGTEIRNAAEPTVVAEGYTGDTYCLGCGAKLASGEVIPKAGVIFDGPGVEDVTFIPTEGTELPKDAEVIIKPHTPSADDLDFLAVEDAPPLNVVENLSDVPVEPHEFGDGTLYGPGGKEYTFYEKLIINGEEYYVDGADADGRLLLFDKKGDAYFYDGNSLGQTDNFEKAIVPDNEFIKINGVVYQIIGKWSGLYALWLDGKPVGAYNLLLETFFYFNEEYAPDKVKERQQNSNQLGTVIPGESPVDGLESGKTYNVSVIGSNDISVPGAENVTGTITQTFAVPDALVGNKDVVYAAVHKTANGNEIGTVTLSEDGKTLTAAYMVSSFSPFTVYAFTEVQFKEFVTQPDGTLVRVINGQPVITHTVASGENLTVIARKYGCTVDEIVALNSDLIENPSVISVGWVLKIPQ